MARKPTIKNITHSEDKLKFIEQKLAQPTLSQHQKRGYLRRFLAGHCAICHEVPTR
jgi:mono/diheme cytochrome c family protein